MKFRIDPLSDLVLVDKVQIQQVLLNLIRNAIEAMEEAPRRELTIASRAPDAGMVEIEVADSGAGIAPEVAERLFTPFATSRANGLGLGLVIAHDIMHELGGALVWVPGETGACFDVALRRAPA